MSDTKLLRTASVHEDELSAIRDSRDRDMPIFSTNDGNITRWVVAVSEHQAYLALVEFVWPVTKLTKRARDERYAKLLEDAYFQPPVELGTFGDLALLEPSVSTK